MSMYSCISEAFIISVFYFSLWSEAKQPTKCSADSELYKKNNNS